MIAITDPGCEKETPRTRHRCIHNDRPAPTRTYDLRGLFAAVIWVALWSALIMAFVSDEMRRRHRVSQYMNRQAALRAQFMPPPVADPDGPSYGVELPNR